MSQHTMLSSARKLAGPRKRLSTADKMAKKKKMETAKRKAKAQKRRKFLGKLKGRKKTVQVKRNGKSRTSKLKDARTLKCR